LLTLSRAKIGSISKSTPGTTGVSVRQKSNANSEIETTDPKLTASADEVNISTKQSIAKRSWGQLQENIAKQKKAFTRFWKRRGVAVAKISILVIFSGAMLFGARNISGANSDQPISTLASVQRYGSTNVDEIAAAEVAASIARDAKLVIADNITNLSDSLAVQVQLAGTDTEPFLGNPSLIATDAKTRQDITLYTVKSGDTISSIAAQFGVTSDTIRWANDLVGNSVSTGKILTILPVSGVRHRVLAGDSATKLASTYKAAASNIIRFNDAEVEGLPVGEWIIIPGGKKPASVAYYNYTPGYSLSYGGNGYTFGYCTWHVANRRAAVGNPIPRGLGNAVTWYARAAAGGLGVSSVPKAGAVAWAKNSIYIAGGDGHVAFVERVNVDGSVWLSHMNSRGGYASMDTQSAVAGGWNRQSFTLHSGTEVASMYLFIY